MNIYPQLEQIAHLTYYFSSTATAILMSIAKTQKVV